MAFAPFSVGYLIASTVAIRLTPWLGSRIIHVGAVLMASALCGVIYLAHAKGATLNTSQLMPVLLLYGIGQGFVMPTLLTTILSGVPVADAGSASGVMTTVQQVAFSVGIAVIGSVFFGVLGPKPDMADFPKALGAALFVNLGLLIATFCLAFQFPRCVLKGLAAAPVEV